MVNSMMKILKGIASISVEWMECLNVDAKKKEKDISCITGSRDNQIATSAKLVDITHECYGFSGDLIETINY